MADDTSGLNLFGFQIVKPKPPKQSEPKSFVPEPNLDGGFETVSSGAGYNSYSIDLDPSAIKSETDLIVKYREISLVAEVDQAISEITDEFLIQEDGKPSITLDFQEKYADKFTDKTKKLIIAEFENILSLLKFNLIGADIIRNFYIDGKLAYHKMYNPDKPKDGITELRPIDVARLKKVIELIKETDPVTRATLIKGQKEYFVYTNNANSNPIGGYMDTKTGLQIQPDSIAYVTSGLIDKNSGMVLSYLHKAIRPLNQLRMMEDSEVIYRFTRAPARRVFYIDTSGMARTKAEQYIKEVMARFKNKQVYDVTTGTLKDAKNHQSILEDFFLPRANGGKGTEITQLEGGSGLGSLENTEYFQQKLWQALNIPLSRLQQGQGAFNIGRSSEINRDEIKFAKFISKLRNRFNILFYDLLKTQLIMKGVTTPDDWEVLKDLIYFRYAQDNLFAELKESDVFRERLNNLQAADNYTGKYFSRRFIMREVLKFTDEQIKDLEEQMAEDMPMPEEPEDPNAEQDQDQQQEPQQ